MAGRLTHVSVRTAVTTAALCGLLGGCGEATLTTARSGLPRQVQVASAVAATAANRQAARRETARLLSLAPVPPGAVAIAARPAGLDGPAMGMDAARSLVDRTRYWRVSSGIEATIAWIRAHPPDGLRASGSTSGAAPSYRMLGIGYSEPDRRGIQDLELTIGVVTLPAGGSAIRADGMAIWLDARPLRDDRAGKRLRVTVTGGCPRNDKGAVDVQPAAAGNSAGAATRLLPAALPTAAIVCSYSGMNEHPARHLLTARRLGAQAARALAQSVDKLPLGHPVDEVRACPMSDGAATVVALSYRDRPDIDLWQDRNGCTFITNGTIMTRTTGVTALR